MTRPSNTSSRLASTGTRVLRCLTGALAALSATAMLAFPAQAGTIVVNGDEWTLSNTGYTQAGGSNADTFARNLIGFLDSDGVAGGNVLIYSTNFGLTGSSLNASLTGYTVTTSTAITFDLATLENYDAIFLGGGGFAKDDAVLADYVNAGGGVYIAAGTGTVPGGSAGEAALWNGFLTDFGLALGTVYNGVSGNQPAGTGPLFDGVTQLYFNNGNTVSASSAASSIRMSTAAGIGLIGVYRSGATPPSPPNGVPLPGTIALLGLGLGMAGMSLRRRKA